MASFHFDGHTGTFISFRGNMAFSLYHNRITVIRKDTRLSHIDRLLYIFLLNICVEREKAEYHESIRGIASETSISLAAVHESITTLSTYGYITATKRKREGGAGHETWHILLPDLARELDVPVTELHVNNVTIYLKAEIDEGVR